jgi:hypothetical protein
LTLIPFPVPPSGLACQPVSYPRNAGLAEQADMVPKGFPGSANRGTAPSRMRERMGRHAELAQGA